MTISHTAKNNITELRIVLNQLSLATDINDIKRHSETARSILTALKFDVKDLEEDRLIEIENNEYTPVF